MEKICAIGFVLTAVVQRNCGYLDGSYSRIGDMSKNYMSTEYRKWDVPKIVVEDSEEPPIQEGPNIVDHKTSHVDRKYLAVPMLEERQQEPKGTQLNNKFDTPWRVGYSALFV